MSKASQTANTTMKESCGAQETCPDFSEETRDYLLSDAGIENLMRKLSDSYLNWQDCPVKRCRRARRCQGPDMICQLKEPSRTAPRAEVEAVNARMRQVVLLRLERIGVW